MKITATTDTKNITVSSVLTEKEFVEFVNHPYPTLTISNVLFEFLPEDIAEILDAHDNKFIAVFFDFPGTFLSDGAFPTFKVTCDFK